MDNREKNRMEMLQSVSDFGDNNKTVLSAIPALPAAFDQIRLIHDELALNLGLITEGTSGKVVSKDVSQETIIQSGLVIAGALYGYAFDIEDQELMTAADQNSKSLRRLRDSEIPVFVGHLLEKAESIGDELAKYGIDEQKKADARNQLDDYKKKFSGLGEGKTNKKTANSTIKLLLSKADPKLKKLDKLMLGFKTEDTALYAKYEAARMIHDKQGARRSTNHVSTVPEVKS
ncbi:MAG: hypothetical protein ACM339_04315 [Ignavibacteria bacterium]